MSQVQKEETVLQRVKRLLASDTRNNSQLAEQSGENYFWIRNVRSGKTENPGIVQTERFLNFLETGVRSN
jgi:hypothetical protein